MNATTYAQIDRNIKSDLSILDSLNLIDEKLTKEVKSLFSNIPLYSHKEWEIYARWGQKQGNLLVSKLQHLLIKYRNIRHPFQGLNDLQKEALGKYYSLNKALFNLVDSAKALDKKTVNRIENTLFLLPNKVRSISMKQTFDYGYALLIGVGRCAESQLSLPVTVKDMQALQQILVAPGLCAYPDNAQHLRLLHDEGATQQAILDGLEWLKIQATADSDATAIVYYSGHGWLESTSGKYYLIPHDFDSYDWRNTALSAEMFNQALRQIPARRLK